MTIKHALVFWVFSRHPGNGIKAVSLWLNHTLNLDRLTSNCSSTTNFLWQVLPTADWILILVLCCAPLYSHSLFPDFLETVFLIDSRHGPHSTESTCPVSECMSVGPLPSAGHGTDHIENTSSVFLYNSLEGTTAENKTCLLLYEVLPLSGLAKGQ